MTTEETTPQPKPSIEELRAEIKQTRAELGETVQALAAKADVKARARDQLEIAKGRARELPVPLVLAGVVAIVGIILVVRGRKR